MAVSNGGMSPADETLGDATGFTAATHSSESATVGSSNVDGMSDRRGGTDDGVAEDGQPEGNTADADAAPDPNRRIRLDAVARADASNSDVAARAAAASANRAVAGADAVSDGGAGSAAGSAVSQALSYEPVATAPEEAPVNPDYVYEEVFDDEYEYEAGADTDDQPAPADAPVAAPEAAAVDAADEVLCVCTEFFPETDDEDVDKDRWMTVRTFLAAMLAEPVLNIFGACDAIDVEVLARALIARKQSSEWVKLAPCVTPVVFIWRFLLLVRFTMDAQPDLCQAVGELMLFCVLAEEQTMSRWLAKAKPAAKEYRDKWEDGDADAYEAWLLSCGVQPAVSHVVARAPSKARAAEQANELRTGQSWPGRAILRPFPEDSTAVKQRLKAACKRDEKEEVKAKEVKGWDVDDCRHNFPESVLRAPGVITFVCGCGYIIGFELLRETESPAHVVAALVQRFKKFPQVVYFDTACQAQRNALRRVPWMMDGVCTLWFIDRFHRCNHTCSPVFNADQYPDLTRGHDTSGAERQHSIKKRSKNSLSYMRQRRFIVRSRIIAAHNNIKVSQRREAAKEANRARAPGQRKVAVEIQHKPVETYYHDFIVDHCEMREGCPCRDKVQPDVSLGLERKM